MKIRLGNAVLTAVAVAVGLVTLVGYFTPALLGLRLQLVAWAGTLAAVAVWVGVISLLRTHVEKISNQSPGWFYSLVLFLSLAVVLLISMLAPLFGWGSGAANAANSWIFTYIQSAIGAAISGLLVFFLVYAGFRILRRQPSVISIVFVVVAVISLVGMAPLPASAPDLGLRDLWIWISQVPAVAGARGLLIGIALGVVATGIRLLLALDRPYGD